jgi:hypothetical protein
MFILLVLSSDCLILVQGKSPYRRHDQNCSFKNKSKFIQRYISRYF